MTSARSARARRAVTTTAAAILLVAQPLSAAAQAPGPPIAVSATSDLVAGQTVTVSGSGWPAGTSIGVAQCAAAMQSLRQDCNNDTALIAAAGTDGTFSVDLPITVGQMGPNGKMCNPGDTCVIAAQGIGIGQQTRVEVTMAAADAGSTSTPAAPTTTSATPATAAASANTTAPSASTTDVSTATTADTESNAAEASVNDDSEDDDDSNTAVIAIVVIVVLVLAAAGLIYVLGRRRR